VENITYSDIVLKDTRQGLIQHGVADGAAIAPPAKVLPIVRNVTIRNVSGTTNNVGFMHGLAGSPISEREFEKCNITADKGSEENAPVDLSGLRSS